MSTNHTLNNNILFSANPYYFQLQFQTIQFCWVVTFISHTKWPFSSDNTVKYELGWEIGFQEHKRFNLDIFQYAGWCWRISQNNLYLIPHPWLTILHPLWHNDRSLYWNSYIWEFCGKFIFKWTTENFIYNSWFNLNQKLKENISDRKI